MSFIGNVISCSVLPHWLTKSNW